MYPLFDLARITSITSFFFYGTTCLLSERMRGEFIRYGLSKFRKLTGSLQILGSLGLLLGYAYPLLTTVSASGLCLLMLLGVGVRLKIHDPWYMVVPAFAYAMLNFVIIIGN